MPVIYATAAPARKKRRGVTGGNTGGRREARLSEQAQLDAERQETSTRKPMAPDHKVFAKTGEILRPYFGPTYAKQGAMNTILARRRAPGCRAEVNSILGMPPELCEAPRKLLYWENSRVLIAKASPPHGREHWGRAERNSKRSGRVRQHDPYGRSSDGWARS
jgi:hypothetical protein